MRIGVIAPPWLPVPPPGYGGTEMVIDLLARTWVSQGHDVLLCASGDSTCPVERVAVHDQAQHHRLGAIVPEAAHVEGAYDAMRDCDVVHDHTLLGPVLAPEVVAPRRRPIVATNHGPFGGELAPVLRAIARRASIVAISHHHASTAGDVPVRAVVHHGLDPDAYPIGRGQGGFVLFLGRMSPDKGAHRAIDVARRAGIPIVLAAKCREPEEQQFFDACIRPRLGPDVEYAGEVGGVEKLELLGDALALVNPIRWPEPFGLVMIEALACGTPVLAFAEGAAPEIVTHGRTGFLGADEDDLTRRLAEVADLDRDDCRRSVEERFSAARMAADYVCLFESLLDGGVRLDQSRLRLAESRDESRRRSALGVPVAF